MRALAAFYVFGRPQKSLLRAPLLSARGALFAHPSPPDVCRDCPQPTVSFPQAHTAPRRRRPRSRKVINIFCVFVRGLPFLRHLSAFLYNFKTYFSTHSTFFSEKVRIAATCLPYNARSDARALYGIKFKPTLHFQAKKEKSEIFGLLLFCKNSRDSCKKCVLVLYCRHHISSYIKYTIR